MAKQFAQDYIDVAERIRTFRELYPTGSLQQVDVKFIDFAGQSWVVFTAAAYRSPEDPRPGIGTAWEPVPGKTPYTRDSEVMVAETSAWGRAIVAALAGDTKRGVASKEEVLNRVAIAKTPLDDLTDLLIERFPTKEARSTFVMDTLQLLDPVKPGDLNDNQIGALLTALRSK